MTDKKPPPTIIFEEGWADELFEDDDFTPEKLQEIMAAVVEMVATGEFFELSTPVNELPEEEQQEIIEMLENRKKNVRH